MLHAMLWYDMVWFDESMRYQCYGTRCKCYAMIFQCYTIVYVVKGMLDLTLQTNIVF